MKRVRATSAEAAVRSVLPTRVSAVCKAEAMLVAVSVAVAPIANLLEDLP